MVLTSLQTQALRNMFNYTYMNQPVPMAVVNYVHITFEENINTGDTTGIKLYIQVSKDIFKSTYKLDISVSNTKKYCRSNFQFCLQIYLRTPCIHGK